MKNLLSVCLAIVGLAAAAQEIKVSVDRPDALYKVGEKAEFTIGVKDAKEGVCRVELSQDRGRTIAKQEHNLADGNPFKVSGSLSEPGFLQCSATFGGAKGIGAAGYEPEKIKPSMEEPADFQAFWDDGMARQRAIKDAVRLIPVKAADDNCESFKVEVTTIYGNKIYGFLSVPKGKGPFPCVVSVPGASHLLNKPHPALWNVINLDMNVHTVDPSPDMETLQKQRNDICKRRYENITDRDKYFYREGILAVNAAIDFVSRMPEFDGRHMVFRATSQGGAMSLTCAGLNEHLTAAVAMVPALCDHGGYKEGRASGWPELASWAKKHGQSEEETLKMASYYDTVNFARRIKVPVMVVAGFIDTTCSPSSVYAAYNVISAPKQISNIVDAGHDASDDRAREAFLRKHLLGDKPQ